MCNCGNNQAMSDNFVTDKLVHPIPVSQRSLENNGMSGLNGININFDLVNVALWFGMFYLGHKVGTKVFGKK